MGDAAHSQFGKVFKHPGGEKSWNALRKLYEVPYEEYDADFRVHLLSARPSPRRNRSGVFTPCDEFHAGTSPVCCLNLASPPARAHGHGLSLNMNMDH